MIRRLREWIKHELALLMCERALGGVGRPLHTQAW